MSGSAGQTAGRFVVVGGGLAGATAALELRKLGHEGKLTLIGGEERLPYNRPPLSKTFLRGEEAFDDIAVAPREEYDRNQIELRLGSRATALEPDRRVVRLEDDEIPYDAVLVATGGRKRRLPFAGSELPGVYDMRAVDDCERIKSEAARAGRVVVVGLGFIGCEIAASLRTLGLEVTALDPLAAPLARILGEEVGDAIARLHREHGVELLLREGVDRFEGADRVERVVSSSGRAIDCDFVVAGIGIEPDADLLAAAGAAVSNGVEVDAACRTSLPGVFAAGDIANHAHPVFGRIRVEHWNNAERQPKVAAAAMLGRDVEYDYIHSFWSDQYDQTLEYVGFATKWDRVDVEGSLENLDFIARYIAGDRLLAAAAIGRGGDPEAEEENELKAIARDIRSARPREQTSS